MTAGSQAARFCRKRRDTYADSKPGKLTPSESAVTGVGSPFFLREKPYFLSEY